MFLSYASQDRDIVLRFQALLEEAGMEVWFDANELRGGDAWDDAIRSQIKHCTFFVPVISAATQLREEGYFRREWKLAVDRSNDMADDRPFIVPVTVLDVHPDTARVPKRFLDLTWVLLPEGREGQRLVEALRLMHRKLLAQGTGLPFDERHPGRGTQPSTSPRRSSRLGRRVAWAALATALVGLGGILLKTRPESTGMHADAARLPTVAAGPPAAPAAAAQIDAYAIAVIPFINATGDPQTEYVSDGLTDELIAALGRDPQQRVVARTSAFYFKDKALPAPQIAEQLKVARLVVGSMRRSGGVLRLNIQLVNGATGYQTWSRDYDIGPRDLFEVQAAVANDVMAELVPASSRPVVARRVATRSLDAYDAYLRARNFQAKPSLRENCEAAVKYLQMAVDADPKYAVAWAGLGSALLRLRASGYDDSEATLKRAHVAIESAIAVDPDLPEAHLALASYFNLHWTNQMIVKKELELARQGLPNSAEILTALAACHLYLGRNAEALRYARQAATIDPQNGYTANFVAILLDIASLYPESLAERERSFRLGGWITTIADKALTIRNWKGDLTAALAVLEEVAPSLGTSNDNNYYWRLRSGFLRALGDTAGALAALDHLSAELVPAQYYYHSKSLLRAQILETSGDAPAARASYETALAGAVAYRDANPEIIRAHTSLALIYAGLGREAEARAEVKRCLDLIPPKENPYLASRTGLRVQAQVDARFGRMDAALETVRSQIAAGFWKRNDLRLDPDWTLLRTDPRFAELAEGAPL